jgi:branched-subunit amino acid ABC-type transport system permease component
VQLLVNGLIAGSLGALIAGGLALVYGLLGIFNLALGQTVLLGGYITWWLHQGLGLPLIVSIIGGLASGALLAWITYIIFVNPFYRHHRFLPLVTTIALSMILDGLILMVFESRPRSILPGLKNTIDIWGARISIEQIVLICVTVIILCAFAYILHSTSFGRKIRAVVQHDHAASSLGIRAPQLHKFVFILSGIFAAAGGIFIGIDQNLSPVLAFPLTIKAYAAIIAGGKGHFWGAIFCAYLIAMLEQFAVGVPWFGGSYIPAGYQQTVALIFIIGFLLFKPAGLFGSKLRSA